MAKSPVRKRWAFLWAAGHRPGAGGQIWHVGFRRGRRGVTLFVEPTVDSRLFGFSDLHAAALADRLAIFPRCSRRAVEIAGMQFRHTQAKHSTVCDGPDAVLVAGSGLIIRLRKDTVGSTPTRPTNRCTVNVQDVMPLSIKWPLGQVMLDFPMGHVLLYRVTVLGSKVLPRGAGRRYEKAGA